MLHSHTEVTIIYIKALLVLESKVTPIFSDYEPEAKRLEFVFNRDGIEGALQFAKQTIVAYRRHVVFKKVTRELRGSFICSYKAFRKFVNDHKS